VRGDIDADLFEIQPAETYPEDYEATVAQAEREKQTAMSRPGDSLAVLRRMAPNARLAGRSSSRMDQERAILREVTSWLQTSGARK
jgi:hypothetical protein